MQYYKFSEYLKKRFGCRVARVSIDAGFSCPNRDGAIGRDGCIFCDNRGFSRNSRIAPRPIEEQIQEGIVRARERFKAEKFIIYFQAYTNTYAPIDVLDTCYSIIKKYEGVVALAIGTRPDCINNDILELIQSYTQDYEVWLEYGLQSMHNKTLNTIQRGHTYEDFLDAVLLTKKRENINICAHVIIGLPNETKQNITETAKAVGKLQLDGIKIHPLHIIKETRLHDMHRKGRYNPLSFDDYVHLAVDFLEYLWPKTVIQRLSADCPREYLVAPEWIQDKHKVLNEIERTLVNRDSFQGRLYGVA